MLSNLQTLGRAQETASTQREPPEVIRITPAAAALQTGIELEGYRLGANLDKGVRVLFEQSAAQYFKTPGDAGYETANIEHGLQQLGIVVPGELQAGPCQVIVEVEGRRSTPFTIKINPSATPPEITSITPHSIQPGKDILIEGTGLSDSDDFELTDIGGRVHHIKHTLNTSNANMSAVRLPTDLPEGEAGLRVIEHRSGTSQASNSLSFVVTRGPTPLDVWADWLMPVAPGQWLDLVVGSEEPLKAAERVEISFRQKDLFLVVLTPPKTLRAQIPETLSPGSAEIQTRTWVAGEASAWSEPVNYRLLDRPAPAKLYGLEIRPVRAEAAFKQSDAIVALVSVDEVDYPRVRVPIDKLSPGPVQVMTRVWRGGQPSAWLSKGFGFSWPTKFLPDGTMGEVPFMERVYLGPDTPKVLTVYPGESLILQGTFPVESVEKLQVTLECDGPLPIELNPTKLANQREARIKLPDDLADGEWDIIVRNLDDRAELKLPVKLRLVKAGRRISDHSR